jgi:hypothetical protein
MMTRSIGNSLTETLKGTDLPSVTGDLGEVAIDALLNEGALKDIPVISTIRGLWQTGIAVRDYIFLQKLLRFLEELGDVSHQERVKMIEQLEQDSSYPQDVGENIILLLDKLDHLEKAKLVGRAFSAYCKGYIDSNTLERLIVSIDRIVLRDISHLKQFCSKPDSTNPAIAQNFVNAGLGYTPSGFASTKVEANLPLCRAFIRHILKEEIGAENKV